MSASWTRLSGASVESVTAGYGRNGTTVDLSRNGAFIEGARHTGPNTLFGRVEVLQLDHAIADVTIGTFTVGGVRDILSRRGLEGGVGAGHHALCDAGPADAVVRRAPRVVAGVLPAAPGANTW